MIDLSEMDAIEIDLPSRTARVGGGVTWARSGRGDAGARAGRDRRAVVRARRRRRRAGRRAAAGWSARSVRPAASVRRRRGRARGRARRRGGDAGEPRRGGVVDPARPPAASGRAGAALRLPQLPARAGGRGGARLPRLHGARRPIRSAAACCSAPAWAASARSCSASSAASRPARRPSRRCARCGPSLDAVAPNPYGRSSASGTRATRPACALTCASGLLRELPDDGHRHRGRAREPARREPLYVFLRPARRGARRRRMGLSSASGCGRRCLRSIPGRWRGSTASARPSSRSRRRARA